ncbi:lipase/acyltransferase domain-containing protein [Variovorax saccharolyticus]|uniref:lipase/acyltransferase domain-containing protein n=1 Tax=Variovorax saccharolyticus TaxID=3053516 RepID=UPI002576204A|nr:hypothetical protein [Variovorax sp. J22R187]MDM0022160.1 hypothetical protein [Variovorax sp. J22R187]
MSDVIVLLPGITGSVLQNGDGKVVWGYSAGTIAKALFSGAATIRRELALPHDDPEVDDLGDGIHASGLMPDLHLLAGLWKIDGYTAIVDMLLANFDLTEGKNFFRFPYDWRRDNRVAARKLARSTHGWLKSRREAGHPNAKLILLAHSMGGLVSRWFIENMEGWRDTRALITFGTPYRGSLNALDNLANGMKKGPMDLTPLVREFTSVYQLLPVFECWDNGSGQLARVGEVSGIPSVDAARAAEALKFHRAIESAVKSNRELDAFNAGGYQTIPIVGTAQKTFLSATANGAGGVTLSELHKGQLLGGDGTVPRVSAIPGEMSGPAIPAMYAATQHGSLQNAEAVLAHLKGVLTGTTIDLGGFLKPKTQVALEVEDIVEQGLPVTVRVRPVRTDVAFELVLRGTAGEQRAKARIGRDGWFDAEFAPPPPGVYRVSVVGPAVEAAEDSFVVAAAEG